MNRWYGWLRRSEDGFTLIELLVVVAIIALLATLAVPKVFDAMNQAKSRVGTSELHTIANALERYYFEVNNYPKDDEIATALHDKKFLKSTTTLHNRFDRGYIYLTDKDGGFYVLVDVKNATEGATMELNCGGAKYDITVVKGDIQADTVTGIGAADVTGGCLISSITGDTTGLKKEDLTVVTN